jgi:porphobilinogen synthase
MAVWADVCLCEYTDHGHCGVLHGEVVDNDATLPLLARASVALARAGADVIAPSDMMDGRVAAIRAALDEAGFAHVVICSYAVKYASAFYGPFRDAAGSTPQFGDRRGYQMDPPNVREALCEALADVQEGADMVMVKPGLPYLDVIRAVRERVDVPVVAYQVSGEFAMLHASAERGWIDLPRAMAETAIALRRAGADLLITYFARELASASTAVAATAGVAAGVR